MRSKRATKQKVVHVIEDDVDIAMGISVRLQANGYEVVASPDAYVGLTRTEDLRPDVIVLDLGLPDRDGFAFLEQLQSREAVADTPVVVLTARDASHREHAYALGVAEYLQKPVDNDVLLAAIDRVSTPA